VTGLGIPWAVSSVLLRTNSLSGLLVSPSIRRLEAEETVPEMLKPMGSGGGGGGGVGVGAGAGAELLLLPPPPPQAISSRAIHKAVVSVLILIVIATAKSRGSSNGDHERYHGGSCARQWSYPIRYHPVTVDTVPVGSESLHGFSPNRLIWESLHR